MDRSPEPETRGALDPPRRPPPTAVGTGTLDPHQGPIVPFRTVRKRQPFLKRLLARVVHVFDSLGDRIGHRLGARHG